MAKTEQVQIQLSVRVPTGTSRTKISKAISTALKSNTPEGFKFGAPKIVSEEHTTSSNPSTTSSSPSSTSTAANI